MKVKELIELLNTFDQELEVGLNYSRRDINHVEILDHDDVSLSKFERGSLGKGLLKCNKEDAGYVCLFGALSSSEEIL